MASAIAYATANGIYHTMAFQVAEKLVGGMENIVSREVSHPDVAKILVELDVKASLSTIKALLEDLQPILSKSGSTIKVCFGHLHASMDAIQAQLDSVEAKCAKHKKSYWSYMYSYPDVSKELKQIKNLKSIMDHRIDLLTKTATIELQLISSRAFNHQEQSKKHLNAQIASSPEQENI